MKPSLMGHKDPSRAVAYKLSRRGRKGNRTISLQFYKSIIIILVSLQTEIRTNAKIWKLDHISNKVIREMMKAEENTRILKIIGKRSFKQFEHILGMCHERLPK